MTAERENLRLDIEYLTVLFPTEVSSFDFQVESTDRTVQYKLNAQSLRLSGLHWDVNDAHRAGANRLQKKKKQQTQSSSSVATWVRLISTEISLAGWCSCAPREEWWSLA